MSVEKAVILWAGCGRRISGEYCGIHKAMIPINGRPLMEYLLYNISKAGIHKIVPILGYKYHEMKEMICDISAKMDSYSDVTGFSSIEFVINRNYENTNNLYSLIQASSILDSEDFVVINGDMVFDYRILRDIMSSEGTYIATDNNDYEYQLDSPRVLIRNYRVFDIGRHMSISEANGYAVGIYRFGKEYSHRYLEEGRRLSDTKLSAGYHEPMEKDFNEIEIKPCYTQGYYWMDVDEKEDVKKAEEMLLKLPGYKFE